MDSTTWKLQVTSQVQVVILVFQFPRLPYGIFVLVIHQ